MPSHFSKNLKFGAWVAVGAFLFVMAWGMFSPYSVGNSPTVQYQIKKGMGYKEIGIDLKKKGFIRNHGFFTLYSVFSLQYDNLQAGNYEISKSLSVAQMVQKFATGDVVKNNITIIEGWNLQDIHDYFKQKDLFANNNFLELAKKEKLEGYIFPDTYNLPIGATARDVIGLATANFDKKLTSDLRAEIARQKKTVFQIVTMASMLEKEVRSLKDKKIVSGILWKRIQAGVPLQVDATVNYASGKSSSPTTIKDTQIDSPYNTYKYYGLPVGPISNPGIDSIMAAIYPEKSPYWYYLSAADDGETIFSRTLDEHNTAIQQHLR